MTDTHGSEQQETIDLQDFLKLRGMVETGGEAKFRVQGGEVRLNGQIETRRRKKLRRGDIVEYAGQRVAVDW
jgi:ribosome-associated protein